MIHKVCGIFVAIVSSIQVCKALSLRIIFINGSWTSKLRSMGRRGNVVYKKHFVTTFLMLA